MKTRGYAYTFYFNIPKIVVKCKQTHFLAGDQTTTKFEFPTHFLLTTNNIYFNISISVLGFGLGLEIQSRS